MKDIDIFMCAYTFVGFEEYNGNKENIVQSRKMHQFIIIQGKQTTT